MLTITICIFVLVAILELSEYFAQQKILGPETKRKFFHICAGSFIAFWPWLMSWRSIEVLGILMFISTIANYGFKIFNFTKGLGRQTYGDSFLAVAITACAFLTHSKIFFMVAILTVSIADALAAVAGQRYGGKKWRYKVGGLNKTLIGTMVFWLATLCIIAIGLPFAHGEVSFNHYEYLIIFVPPIAAFLENFSWFGADNLVVPVSVALLLRGIS